MKKAQEASAYMIYDPSNPSNGENEGLEATA